MPPESPLLARLSALLQLDEEPAPAAAPPPAPTPDDLKVAQVEKVIGVVGKLLVLFKERMVLLQAAGQQARVLAPSPLEINPKLQLQIALVADFLRQNREAAKLVGSAVMRYLEAPADLARIETMLARRQIQELNVEHLKGKYLFLTKINVYFKDYPLLYSLFKPAQKPGAPAAETAPLGPTPIRAAANTASLNAGRSTAPLALKDVDLAAARRSLTGESDLIALTGGRPSGVMETERLVIQGKKLLAGLDMRMVILKVACDQVLKSQGEVRGSAPLLPLPAQETARHVAAVLAEEPHHFQRARELLGVYGEAKNALNQRPLKDPPRVKHLLTTITTLPYQFKGNPLLEQLFLGRTQLAT